MKGKSWRTLGHDIVGMKTLSGDELGKWLVLAYRAGLRTGYDLAEDDFFHAERHGEPDPEWFSNRPALKRVLAGLKRWYP